MEYEEYFDARDTGSRSEIPCFSSARSTNAESEVFSAGYLEKYYPT